MRTTLRIESIRVVTRSDRIEGSLQEYALRDWVIGGPAGPIGSVLRLMCHDAGFSPHVIAETDDHRITFDVIRQAGAVSLVPELALAELPDDIAIDEEIDLPLQRRIEFVTRPSMSDNRAVAECARVSANAFASGAPAVRANTSRISSSSEVRSSVE
ncbi:LysR substrate-binding domain-containing protein [Ilumatobacter sp.]|uniref:LysR substrate-binding domain-containing protein n=1 Tax=Ilumatobacter sp. TaxID=1967498 RepID=UPI00375050F8